VPMLLLAAAVVGILRPREIERGDDVPLPRVNWPLLLASIVLIAGATWAGLEAIAQMLERIRRDDAGILATILIAPTLTLAPIGVATRFVRFGRPGPAIASLLSLSIFAAVVVTAVLLLVAMLLRQPSAFPARLWRIDAVVLMLAGLLLAPAAAGASRAGRLEGAVLVVLYVGYLVASVVAS
jgi:Ca2+/Na+ antiporter